MPDHKRQYRYNREIMRIINHCKQVLYAQQCEYTGEMNFILDHPRFLIMFLKLFKFLLFL